MRTALAISFTLALSATDVAAACNQASLQGNWHYFASNVVYREDFSVAFTYIEDCRFQITRQGVVRNARCIDQSTVVPWGTTDFSINGNCSIRASAEFCDVTGQISRNKQTVSGIGFCCCYEEEPDSGVFTLEYENSFTLVKTTPAGAGVAALEVEPQQVQPVPFARGPRQ